MTYAYIPIPPGDIVTKVTKAHLGVAARSFAGWASRAVKRPFVTFVTVSLGVGGAGPVRALAALVDALNPSLRGLFSVAPTPVSRFSREACRAGNSNRDFALLRGSHKGVK